jgi:HSP20 family protein
MTVPTQQSEPTQQSGRQTTRWDLVRPFEELYTQMGRLLESTFKSGPGNGWAPLADLRETDVAYIIDIDVPGVRRDDLNVEVSRNELTVTGELKETEREGLFRKRTRHVGRFIYRTTLPRDVEPNSIDANLANGVLTLRIPKAETAGPRKIRITT